MSVEKLNALNEELLIRLHESGIAAPSYTTLNGEYCLRAALSNHRTRREDLTVAIAVVRKPVRTWPIGESLESAGAMRELLLRD